MLSQHHQVTEVDIVPEKVDLINNRKSPIQDDYIEKYLAKKKLNLTATLDAKTAYADAEARDINRVNQENLYLQGFRGLKLISYFDFSCKEGTEPLRPEIEVGFWLLCFDLMI